MRRERSQQNRERSAMKKKAKTKTKAAKATAKKSSRAKKAKQPTTRIENCEFAAIKFEDDALHVMHSVAIAVDEGMTALKNISQCFVDAIHKVDVKHLLSVGRDEVLVKDCLFKCKNARVDERS